MARTYKKAVKFGICTGYNTEYYRNRNRKERAKNRHQLRNLIANHDMDTVNDLAYTIFVPYDDYNEPTDGHFCLTNSSKNDWDDRLSWNRKVGKYLKPKHSNHSYNLSK